MIGLDGIALLSSTDSLVLAGTFGLALVASLLVFWATRKYLESYAKRTATRIDDVIVSILKDPVIFLIISLAAIFLVRTIVTSPSASLAESLTLGYLFVILLFATWTVAKLFVVMMHRTVQSRALKTQTRVDDVVVTGVTKTGRILILLVGVAIALGLLFLGLGLLRLSTG